MSRMLAMILANLCFYYYIKGLDPNVFKDIVGYGTDFKKLHTLTIILSPGFLPYQSFM